MYSNLVNLRRREVTRIHQASNEGRPACIQEERARKRGAKNRQRYDAPLLRELLFYSVIEGAAKLDAASATSIIYRDQTASRGKKMRYYCRHR
jgi:hypothetical protein